MPRNETERYETSIGTALATEKQDGHFDITIELYDEFPRQPSLAWNVPLPSNPASRASILTGILTAYKAGIVDGEARGRSALQKQFRDLLEVAHAEG